MGWNAYGWTEDKIIITKASLLDYAEHYGDCNIDDIINYFFNIHQAENNQGKKQTIEIQVREKIKILIEKVLLKEKTIISIHKKHYLNDYKKAKVVPRRLQYEDYYK